MDLLKLEVRKEIRKSQKILGPKISTNVEGPQI
jgi:hypothetical protein